ncbi:MAG TPA: CcoQ/FixQ family Cbb3-type cytochrome c oxidase assembly chaperone [Burkholderiaceae bacterium]|nr:CcoQ/FixQ family Cbb3-type cytochrome c oxidase assembly chaperone [Burkholderiaceae bacterium]
MELNDLRAALMVLGFLGFVGIVAWAYSKGARKGFKEASELPFADEEQARGSADRGKDK